MRATEVQAVVYELQAALRDILWGCCFSEKLSSPALGCKSLNVVAASALYCQVVFLT